MSRQFILCISIYLLQVPLFATTTTCDGNEVLVKDEPVCPTEYCPKSEDSDKGACEEVSQPSRCICRFNHRRAENGTCVPTETCPPFECSRENEEYNCCPPICPTDDCSMAPYGGECPPYFGRIGIILPYNPKCRCKKGFYRYKGTCVTAAECPNFSSTTTTAAPESTCN